MNLPIVCYDRKLGSPPSVMLLLTHKRPNGEDCMSLFLQALAQEIDSCIKSGLVDAWLRFYGACSAAICKNCLVHFLFGSPNCGWIRLPMSKPILPQSIYSFRGVDALFGVRRSLHFNGRCKFHAQDLGFQYFWQPLLIWLGENSFWPPQLDKPGNLDITVA